MQIGLGHLQVSSSVEWRGGDRDVPSAVRVDVMTVESRNINLAVGMGTKPLSDMVQELAGLSVMVQRPLRDLFKRLPSMEIHVKVRHVTAGRRRRRKKGKRKKEKKKKKKRRKRIRLAGDSRCC